MFLHLLCSSLHLAVLHHNLGGRGDPGGGDDPGRCDVGEGADGWGDIAAGRGDDTEEGGDDAAGNGVVSDGLRFQHPVLLKKCLKYLIQVMHTRLFLRALKTTFICTFSLQLLQ